MPTFRNKYSGKRKRGTKKLTSEEILKKIKKMKSKMNKYIRKSKKLEAKMILLEKNWNKTTKKPGKKKEEHEEEEEDLPHDEFDMRDAEPELEQEPALGDGQEPEPALEDGEEGEEEEEEEREEDEPEPISLDEF